MLNISEIRNQFPILKRTVHQKPLIYFDNGATTQKPLQVIKSIEQYYQNYNANIHRGVHTLSQEATIAYEEARTAIQQFINAKSSSEVIFTKGTTESINLVADSFSRAFLKEGDEVVISYMEHHSNILPWQKLQNEKGIKLKVIPILNDGTLDIEAFKKLITTKTKLVSVTHVSNTLGTVNPIQEIVKIVRSAGAKILIDGAQAVPHLKIDVQAIDADFYVFSAHKIYGPTGIGVLYGKEYLLEQMPPYQYGGGIIKNVSFDKTEFAELPLKFEAGTPPISSAVATRKALEFINEIGIENIKKHEDDLMTYATQILNKQQNITIIGKASQKAGVISFTANAIHPFDIGTLLDQQGIAVRTGHHCTQPLMQFYKIPGTVRISFAVYNTIEELNIFESALKKTLKMLN
jgi:cysteine desulfurase/selenocysteine lyase